MLDANFGSRSESNYDWETLYAGYRWDTDTAWYHVRRRNRCLKCGCRLSLKARGRAFKCPLDKWPKV